MNFLFLLKGRNKSACWSNQSNAYLIFNTEIECNEEKESDKEDQILLDIQKEKSENESIKTVSSNIKACISLSLGEMMDKAMNYKMNDIFISKMQSKIEQKFIKY